MKINEQQLRKIIREEISKLQESEQILEKPWDTDLFPLTDKVVENIISQPNKKDSFLKLYVELVKFFKTLSFEEVNKIKSKEPTNSFSQFAIAWSKIFSKNKSAFNAIKNSPTVEEIEKYLSDYNEFNSSRKTTFDFETSDPALNAVYGGPPEKNPWGLGT